MRETNPSSERSFSILKIDQYNEQYIAQNNEQNNEQNNQIDSDKNGQNNYNGSNPDEEKNKINENTNKKTTLQSLHINLNNEFNEKIFAKYKQDNCISNYTILRNSIDLNISIDMEELKNVKLLYFFDCFKDINRLSLDIPFINEKGKLLINEFNPTLSSMRLILKASKKTAKK